MNQLDKKIETILEADIYEPDSYTDAILNAFNTKTKRKIINFPRLVAAIIAGAMIISGVVYAKQIGEFFMRFFNNSKGTDTAVANGYVTEFSKEFTTNSDTKVIIQNLLIDDYDLNFTLDFEFERKYGKVESITILDLLVTDEYNNILLCKNKDIFDKFCGLNNLDYSFLEYNENYINASLYKTMITGTNKVAFNIRSTKEFPKSNKLKIEFNTILFETENSKQKRINGNWQTEIELEEKFYNRDVVIYKAVNIKGLEIKDIILKTYNTETLFVFNALTKPYITDDMSVEEKRSKRNEFKNWCSSSTNRPIQNIYLETEDGKIYNKLSNNIEDEATEYLINGRFHYETSFDLTKYDLTDTLTIYFTLHTINEDRDVVIKLQREDIQ